MSGGWAIVRDDADGMKVWSQYSSWLANPRVAQFYTTEGDANAVIAGATNLQRVGAVARLLSFQIDPTAPDGLAAPFDPYGLSRPRQLSPSILDDAEPAPVTFAVPAVPAEDPDSAEPEAPIAPDEVDQGIGSADGVRKRNRRLRVTRASMDAALAGFLLTPGGMAFMRELLAQCHPVQMSFVPGQSDLTLVREGQRSVGNFLLLHIKAAAPELLASVLFEGNE